MNEHTEPDQIITGPGPRSRQRANRRAGVVGLVAVGGLAAGGAALYVANSAGAAPSTSASTSSSSAPGSSSTSTTASRAATCTAPKPGAGGRPGGGPRAGGPGPGRGPVAGNGSDGRITAVSSTSLTVRDLFAKSHTYKITSATVIHSGPARSTKLSSLTVGEHVVVRTAGSTTTAADIDLHLARIDGSVTSVTGAAITVTDRDGFTRTIDTTAQTKYTLDSAASSRAKVTTGSVVHAEGKVDADGMALDAASVDVAAGAKAPAARPQPCAPAGGHGPARPGHHAGGPAAPKPSSSGSTGKPATPTPSATTTR
jgi:Domain of unknown function (DUF5666)